MNFRVTAAWLLVLGASLASAFAATGAGDAYLDASGDVAKGDSVDFVGVSVSEKAGAHTFVLNTDKAIKLWFLNSLRVFIFLDADKNPATGYALEGGGAEWLIRGFVLWRYTGRGGNWKWEVAALLETAPESQGVRIVLPGRWLAGATSFNFYPYADNPGRPDVFDQEGRWLQFPRPATAIRTDGNFDDWKNIPLLAEDRKGDGAGGADFTGLRASSDAGRLYFLLEAAGALDSEKISQRNLLFLDTDGKDDTGYRGGFALGADALVVGGYFYSYQGKAPAEWRWSAALPVPWAASGSRLELALPRARLGPGAGNSVRLLWLHDKATSPFVLNPEPVEGSKHERAVTLLQGDLFDDAGRGIAYPPTPTRYQVEGLFADWAETGALGADPVGDAGNKASDLRYLWLATDSGRLYGSYEAAGNLENNPREIRLYLDSDANPRTGYAIGALGADVLIEGSAGFRFSGSKPGEWRWSSITGMEFVAQGPRAEFSLPLGSLAQLGNSAPALKTLLVSGGTGSAGGSGGAGGDDNFDNALSGLDFPPQSQDFSAPILTFFTPSEAALVASGTLKISGRVVDVGSGLVKADTRLELDGVRQSALSWSWQGDTFSTDLKSLPSGTHRVAVFASDKAGNTARLDRIIHVADQDGLDDLWELRVFGDLTHTASADDDGDGLSNLEESQRGTDPTRRDSDGDGLSDGDEVRYGLDPNKSNANTDSDGDGLDDLLEIKLGRRPDRPAIEDSGNVLGLELFTPLWR